MRGNSFGKLFSFTTFGESHGEALGVVIDGFPAGITIDEVALRVWMDRRRPGLLAGTSPRQEPDSFEILSGIWEGKSLGTPIAIIVRNCDARSEDYKNMAPRAGHGDLNWPRKFSHCDLRGGGRASGRETVARVMAGFFANLILPQTCQIQSFVARLGSKIFYPDIEAIFTMAAPSPSFATYGTMLEQAGAQGEVLDARVGLVLDQLPVALGEPVFDKLKADLAKAICSIGGCYGVLFHQTHGMEGGISSGARVAAEIYFKAPASRGEVAKSGRHDPALVPRVLVVVESMVACVLADHFLRQRAYE